MIVITSGPSGAGKSRLTDMTVKHLGWNRLVPHTSRPPRPSERPGIDYRFLTRQEFRDGIRRARYFDWDYLLGHYYGYEQELSSWAERQEIVIIPVVARMAVRLRQRLDGVVLVFLDGPDEVLDQRVVERITSPDEMALRRAHRDEEREHASLFDFSFRDAATMDARATDDAMREVLSAVEELERGGHSDDTRIRHE